MTLETAEPTFGVGLPSLPTWTVSVYRPVLKLQKSIAPGGGPTLTPSARSGRAPPRPSGYAVDQTVLEESTSVQYQEAYVNSKGNITATFGVPGKISIPSDYDKHSVAIVKLNLDAKMRWITVPKQEAKTHLHVSFNLSCRVLMP